MQELNVKHSSLSTASGDIQDQSVKIGQVMDDLEAALKSKLQANWQGQASNAFDETKKTFNAGMADLNSLLADISRLVDEVNQRYADVDRRESGRYSAR